MITPTYQTKKFAEIKHLLPEDTWVIQRNRHRGELEEELVSLHEGDLALDQLNLDFTDAVSQILVTGNLTVKNIVNDETDGAVGLIVLGDLTADNITVGGQEIYVAGNLIVHDLFWGDYNHGELKVSGRISAKAFLATEEYNVDWMRLLAKDRTDIPYLIIEGDHHDYSRSVLLEIFEEACVLKEEEIDEEVYGFKDWLNTTEISRRLRENIPLLLKEGRKKEDFAIPFVFPDEYLTDDNMERFRTSPLFSLFGSSEEALKKIEFWRGDRFTRLSVRQNKPYSAVVYLEHKDDHAIMVHYVGHESKLYRSIVYKSISGEDTGWHSLNFQSPLLEDGWKSLLKEVSAMEYYQQVFREKVTVEKVQEILALPLVKEKYNAYDDESSQDLYINLLMCSFRQPTAEKSGRITIIRSFPYKEGDERYAFYHFDIRPEGEVRLRTQDKDGYESETYNVPMTDVEKFKDALLYFETLEKKMIDFRK